MIQLIKELNRLEAPEVNKGYGYIPMNNLLKDQEAIQDAVNDGKKYAHGCKYTGPKSNLFNEGAEKIFGEQTESRNADKYDEALK